MIGGTKDLLKLSTFWLDSNSSVGLRTKMGYSLSTAMIMRGESLQLICLADICMSELESEGRIEAMCMVATLRQGTLQFVFFYYKEKLISLIRLNLQDVYDMIMH